MATLIATAFNVITVVGGAGQAVTVQLLAGNPVNGQTIIAQLNLTGAQNTALVSALTAGAATTTTLQYAAQESPLAGVYQAF